jgi:hypothetical protein
MSDILNEADRQGATWLKLKAYLEGRLQSHRARNDGKLSAEDTAELRGQIKEVKHLLGIDVERPEIRSPVMAGGKLKY